MPVVARHFDQIDTDKDGYVTPGEIEAARRARPPRPAGGNAGVNPAPATKQ